MLTVRTLNGPMAVLKLIYGHPVPRIYPILYQNPWAGLSSAPSIEHPRYPLDPAEGHQVRARDAGDAAHGLK